MSGAGDRRKRGVALGAMSAGLLALALAEFAHTARPRAGQRACARSCEVEPARASVLIDRSRDVPAVEKNSTATESAHPDDNDNLSSRVERLARHDPAAAVQLLRSLPHSSSRAAHVPAVYRILADSAPALIADSIAALVSDPLERQRIVEELLRPALETDFDAGLRLFACVTEPAAHAAALRDVACVFAANSLPGAVEWLRELPAGPERRAVANGVLSHWAEHDLPAALAWFQALPGDDRHHLLAQLVPALLQHAPERAASVLSDAGFDAFETNLSPLLRSWIERDVAAAAAWVVSLDARRQAHAGHTFASCLLEAAPDTAAHWIRALPTHSPIRSQAVVARYEQLRRETPAAAIAWLAEMADVNLPEHRSRLTATLEVWIDSDRPAALAWLNRTRMLSPAQIAAVLSERN